MTQSKTNVGTCKECGRPKAVLDRGVCEQCWYVLGYHLSKKEEK